jgi:hypothetical protein
MNIEMISIIARISKIVQVRDIFYGVFEDLRFMDSDEIQRKLELCVNSFQDILNRRLHGIIGDDSPIFVTRPQSRMEGIEEQALVRSKRFSVKLLKVRALMIDGFKRDGWNGG